MNIKNFFVVILATISCFIFGCVNSSQNNGRKCIDVTSYDHNRNNDMKCTSSKWAVQYTSYEWAKILMWK